MFMGEEALDLPNHGEQYAPFFRTDIYGTMGIHLLSAPPASPVMASTTSSSADSLASFSFLKQIFYGEGAIARRLTALRTCLALVTLAPIRVTLVVVVVMSYYWVICFIILWSKFVSSSGDKGLSIRQWGSFFARLLLFSLGFFTIQIKRDAAVYSYSEKVEGFIKQDNSDYISSVLHGQSETLPPTTVSNHVSWVDIPLLMYSCGCPSFVSKASVKNIPFIGKISEMMQCVFVDREKRESKGKDDGDSTNVSKKSEQSGKFKSSTGSLIRDRMNGVQTSLAPSMSTSPLLIFPEGTTSNGDFLLPFHSGAFIAGRPVRLIIIKYALKNGGVSLAWESISGIRHFLLVCCQLSHSASVHEIGSYKPSGEELNDAKMLSRRVRELMAGKGSFTLTKSSLPEKRAYHKLLLTAKKTV